MGFKIKGGNFLSAKWQYFFSGIFIYIKALVPLCSRDTSHYSPFVPQVNKPQRQETSLRTCARSEDSDQPAHSRSLIGIFNGRILDSQ